MKIRITNLGKYEEGILIYEWVTLPIEEDELNEVLEKIGINEQYKEFFISDYECEVVRIYQYSDIEALSSLAEDLEELSTEEMGTLKAIMDWGYYGEATHRAIENIKDFQLYGNIHSEEELGKYWLFESGCYKVPYDSENCIDVEKWGRDYSINRDGAFTKYGWIEYNGISM